MPEVLARNSEKFRTLTIGRFKIQDSLEHISASLDALVQDLNQTSNFSFPILQQMKRFQKIPIRQKSKAFKKKRDFLLRAFSIITRNEKKSKPPNQRCFLF